LQYFNLSRIQSQSPGQRAEFIKRTTIRDEDN